MGNLLYASPATVSRAGMVYVDPKNLRYAPYWQRWVLTRHQKQRELLNVIKLIFWVLINYKIEFN